MKKSFLSGSWCVLLLAPLMATAATSSSLSNTAALANECTVRVDSNLVFGTYDPLVANASAAKTTTAGISTICASSTTVYLNLNAGLSPGSGGCGLNNRRLRSGTNYIGYQLHKLPNQVDGWVAYDSAYCGPAVYGAAMSSVGASSVTVYGTIMGGKSATQAGSYSDSIVVTVSF